MRSFGKAGIEIITKVKWIVARYFKKRNLEEIIGKIG
jgi:hypothetical protein